MQKVKIKEENEGGQQTVATVGGNRQEKRKRIMSYFINATIELMEKEGIENLTIRKVAEQATVQRCIIISLIWMNWNYLQV